MKKPSHNKAFTFDTVAIIIAAVAVVAVVILTGISTYNTVETIHHIRPDMDRWQTVKNEILAGKTQVPDLIFHKKAFNNVAHEAAKAIIAEMQKEKALNNPYLNALPQITWFPLINIFDIDTPALPKAITDSAPARLAAAETLKTCVEALKENPGDPSIKITDAGDYYEITKHGTQTVLGKPVELDEQAIWIRKDGVSELEKSTGFSFNDSFKTQVAQTAP